MQKKDFPRDLFQRGSWIKGIGKSANNERKNYERLSGTIRLFWIIDLIDSLLIVLQYHITFYLKSWREESGLL